MRWLTRSLRNWLPTRNSSRPARKLRNARPQLEVLEDRCLPALTTGTVSGFAFIDANTNGVRDPAETTLRGMPINLTGKTNAGTSVGVTAVTDNNGFFTFLNVPDGTYTLGTGTTPGFLGNSPCFGGSGAPPGGAVVNGITVTDAQTVTQDIGLVGIDPAFISLRMFLTTSTLADFPFPAAGTGQATAASRPNNTPVVSAPLNDLFVKPSSPNTVIDLAGNFTDPDITDSQVRVNTSMGPINVELFDTKAPRTVANFFNYANSGRYINSIFHRLVPGFVLQGGGFTFSDFPGSSSPPTLNTIPTDPPVQNEFGTSNTQGTIAMAKLGGDPNSATDQFFFNLADNSSNLDNQNGGFTVFGKIDGAADQATLNALASVTTQNHGSPFDQIPLVNYNGTNFPSDTTASNFELVNSVTTVSRTEFLTYSLVSNSNPNLVTVSLNNNHLTLAYAPGQTGVATIVIRATDSFGASVDARFNVAVG